MTCTPEKVRERLFNKGVGLQEPNSGRTQVQSVTERGKHTLMGKVRKRVDTDGSEERLLRTQKKSSNLKVMYMAVK